MAPALLEADPGADEDQRQVVVEDVRPQGHDDDEPTGERDRDQQEPRPARAGEVAQRVSIQGAREPGARVGQPRSASGTGFRGSGPMYSDCGRIMRLWAACSST